MTAKEIENIIANELKNGKIPCDWKLSIGEYTKEYGTFGCFQKNKQWFVFWNDERDNSSINGPLSEEGVMYILVHDLHLSRLYDRYTFSDEDRKNFRTGIYYDLNDIGETK